MNARSYIISIAVLLLLAGPAVANGTSTIRNVAQIDRGYERIDDKLRGLGAEIIRENA